MELTKDIKISEKEILKNTTITLTYSGKLIEDDCDKLYIIYGFNSIWNNASEKEMLPCENGFKVDIELGDNTSLDFCFRNSNGKWDNNENNNYTIQIKEKDTSLVVTNIGELSLRPRLRKTYIWGKKIRLAIYKLINSLPRFITGNYRRRINL